REGSRRFRVCEDVWRAWYDAFTELPTITTGFDRVGPWFVTCDHGCLHGEGRHGKPIVTISDIMKPTTSNAESPGLSVTAVTNGSVEARDSATGAERLDAE